MLIRDISKEERPRERLLKYGVSYLSKFKARNSDAEVYREFL